jgi:hypothetical protein
MKGVLGVRSHGSEEEEEQAIVDRVEGLFSADCQSHESQAGRRIDQTTNIAGEQETGAFGEQPNERSRDERVSVDLDYYGFSSSLR